MNNSIYLTREVNLVLVEQDESLVEQATDNMIDLRLWKQAKNILSLQSRLGMPQRHSATEIYEDSIKRIRKTAEEYGWSMKDLGTSLRSQVKPEKPSVSLPTISKDDKKSTQTSPKT